MMGRGTQVCNECRQIVSAVEQQPPALESQRQGSHWCIPSQTHSVTGAYHAALQNNSSEAANLVQPSMGSGLRCIWLVSDGV